MFHLSIAAAMLNGTCIESCFPYYYITLTTLICKLCDTNNIENEYHFICICPIYGQIRKLIFQHATAEDITFNGISLNDKFIYLMRDCQMEGSKYISEAWKIRQLTM